MLKGLYIHIPFCHKRCSYCSFYSQTDIGNIPAYIDALQKEIDIKRGLYQDFFDGGEATLYIGGGNPSVLSIDEISKILNKMLKLNFGYREITIEANPDSLTLEKIRAYKDLGINRISVGVQSFEDHILKILGRNHRGIEAKKAIELVKEYFDNYSIDIIGGIDGSYNGEKINRALENDLKEIEKIKPLHISFYLLSVEKNTPFYNSFKIDEDKQALDYETFISFAKENGYIHYEISSYAKAGFESLHNTIYWERKDYLGFGASAASYLGDKKEIRIRNVANISEYIKDPGNCEIERLSRSEITFELIFLPLRTKRGLDLDNLKPHLDAKTYEVILKNLINLKKSGFLIQEKGKWIIKEEKYLISNEIISAVIKGAEI